MSEQLPHEATNAPAKKQAGPVRAVTLLTSYVLLAVIALALVDLSSRWFWRCDPYASANRSWAYWAVKDFRSQKEPPQIAVFGSSLMLAALNDGDATFVNAPFDAVSHHQALYLEQLLSKKLGHPVSTASFAIGGQMASDAYALAKTLLSDQQKPRVIVWGIAPRDFVDATFADARNTETVHYMQRISGKDVLGLGVPFWRMLEQGLESASNLYGHRQELISLQERATRFVLTNQFGIRDLDGVRTPQPLLQQAKAALPEDNGVKQWMVTPYSANAPKFADNTAEYRSRYNPFVPKKFNLQLSFYEKLLELGKKEGMHCIIVNMPLTRANLDLLPAGVYERYLAATKDVAQKLGATYLDLNQEGMFKEDEFADTVHLNGLGGQRFFSYVCEQLLRGKTALVGRQPL